MRTSIVRQADSSPMLPVEHFEASMRRLNEKIPSGIDPTLDSYRQVNSDDANYSTTLNRQVRAFLLLPGLC